MKPTVTDKEFLSLKRRAQCKRLLSSILPILLLIMLIAAPTTVFVLYITNTPPINSKALSLDNDDFGLGFKVGDEWNQEAYEKAMRTSGISVQKFKSPNAIAPTSINWESADGVLNIEADPNYTTQPNSCWMISITYQVKNDSAFIEQLRAKGKKLYPSDKSARNAYYKKRLINFIAETYPQIRTNRNIGIGSTESSLIQAYGTPSAYWDADSGNSMQDYIGHKRVVTFAINEGLVSSIYIHPGYDSFSTSDRIDRWLRHILAPITKSLIESK